MGNIKKSNSQFQQTPSGQSHGYSGEIQGRRTITAKADKGFFLRGIIIQVIVAMFNRLTTSGAKKTSFPKKNSIFHQVPNYSRNKVVQGRISLLKITQPLEANVFLGVTKNSQRKLLFTIGSKKQLQPGGNTTFPNRKCHRRNNELPKGSIWWLALNSPKFSTFHQNWMGPSQRTPKTKLLELWVILRFFRALFSRSCWGCLGIHIKIIWTYEWIRIRISTSP